MRLNKNLPRRYSLSERVAYQAKRLAKLEAARPTDPEARMANVIEIGNLQAKLAKGQALLTSKRERHNVMA
jgi:hypothetical protein